MKEWWAFALVSANCLLGSCRASSVAIGYIGLMVSSLLSDEATALELSVGVFYPIIFVGGKYVVAITVSIVTVCTLQACCGQ